MVALFTVGLLATACGVSYSSRLSGANSTVSSLQHAGYRNVGVSLESGIQFPSGGLVGISYSAGPAGNAETDAYNAERIVWNTLRYRFSALTISQTSGGCARGVFCESSSTEIGRKSYAQLRAEFGPRPAGLDKTSVSQTDPTPPWLPGVASVCVTAAAITTAIAVTRARHRRRDGRGVRRQQ
jgi:hypothetical protein